MLDPAFLPPSPGIALIGASVLGAIVGSFLGAALVRMPEGRSVVTGRSACDGCGKALTVMELVPVLSWLAQRGKCRACGARIGRGQLACELGGAAVGIGAVLVAREGLVLAAMLLGWQLLLLALLDLRHLWLPRVLVGWLAGSGGLVVLARAWFEQDVGPVLIAAGGAALGFLMLWLIARFYLKARGREGMGSGDPPLLGAIGIWLGPLGVVEVMLGASILGIAAAIVMLVSKRKIDAETALPLGTCLAATAWPLFLLQGLG
ncbi:prepilin peptidase [Novosphingobium taihuense]|uniref:Prepilin leader peptidase/N-methyltransferase n=1 Tax=Novosphingobium taihuense TaxID=260085 RepID=A0A7W7ESR1_9SPHN|nr:A24 family peptidase [Novosphingobium taihuense]MBB4612573.1 leader peptidase (prepilin peptidase)/N-methyltransferase [Novosphingobium taihuense]TWH88075.1 leader peptidase (prepilin peptidase)/N-methyltransferase [Novosphingobium taihuense]